MNQDSSKSRPVILPVQAHVPEEHRVERLRLLTNFLPLLVVFVLGGGLLFFLNSLRKRKKSPPRPEKTIAIHGDLEKTIAQFRKLPNVSAGNSRRPDTDTGIDLSRLEKNLEASRESSRQKTVLTSAPAFPEPVERAADADGDQPVLDKRILVDTVFQMSEQGLNAKQISETLRVPFDQVNLILRFKPHFTLR